MSPLSKQFLLTGVAWCVAFAGALGTAAQAGTLTLTVLVLAACSATVQAGGALMAYLSAPPGEA